MAAAVGGAALVVMADGALPTSGGAAARPVALVAARAAEVPPQVRYLIWATLGALQDANTTGNYSVLRDLAAPSFQAKHSASALADIFATARRQPIDLAAAATTEPVVTAMVRPEPQALQLEGYLPGADAGARERIGFQLLFEAVAGHWRLAGIDLAVARVAR